MPAYCTPQDLEDRYGEVELFQLAPGAGGRPDQARVQRACDDAGDLVDGYLRPRHTLPLSATPTILVQLSAAIARYRLHLGGDRQPTEQVKADRNEAIQFLRDVSTGKADLGIAPNGAEPAEDTVHVHVAQGEPPGLTGYELGEYRFGRGRW